MIFKFFLCRSVNKKPGLICYFVYESIVFFPFSLSSDHWKMFIAFYFMTITILVIRRLEAERNFERDPDQYEMFGLRMFVMEPYYTFLEMIHSKQQGGFLLCFMCGVFWSIASVEITLFLVIRFSIKIVSSDSPDYAVFWFMAFVFSEGLLIGVTMCAMTFMKICTLFRKIQRKRDELIRQGLRGNDLRTEIQEVDLEQMVVEEGNETSRLIEENDSMEGRKMEDNRLLNAIREEKRLHREISRQEKERELEMKIARLELVNKKKSDDLQEIIDYNFLNKQSAPNGTKTVYSSDFEEINDYK